MPRTEREIATYMAYYSTRTDRKWALENLCRTERKTPEEIRAICDKFNNKGADTMAKGKPIPQEKREAILADRDKGMTAKEIAAKYEVGKSTIGRIIAAKEIAAVPVKKRDPLTIEERRDIVKMLREGTKRADIAAAFELDPTGVDKIKNGMDSNPHYTYKTWDNMTTSERESVLKRVASGELSITAVVNGWLSANQIIQEAYNEYIKQRETGGGYWYAFLGELREFATGILGAGIAVTSASTSETDEFATITVKTADGKRVEFRVEALTDAE